MHSHHGAGFSTEYVSTSHQSIILQHQRRETSFALACERFSHASTMTTLHMTIKPLSPSHAHALIPAAPSCFSLACPRLFHHRCSFT